MSTYLYIRFPKTNQQNDLLIALLSELNFDSFEELSENELKAYVQQSSFDENELKFTLTQIPSLEEIPYELKELADKNWNEEWEKNFQAILISNQCTVRATFHEKATTPIEIIIAPKMAFGTGHHATTAMVMELMLNLNFTDKQVLDFGCGTAILSILAKKLGAKNIIANDIEEAAFENSKENIALNQCKDIEVLLGDMEVVPQEKFPIVIANVTTNVILDNFNALYSLLAKQGDLILSGILEEQEEAIQNAAQSLNLIATARKQKDKWLALQFKK